MHRRHRQRLLMKSAQIVRDLAGAEVVVLPQIQNLAHDLARRGRGGSIWPTGAVPQADLSLRVESSLPAVVRLARDPEMPTCPGDVTRARGSLPQHPHSPRPQTRLL